MSILTRTLFVPSLKMFYDIAWAQQLFLVMNRAAHIIKEEFFNCSSSQSNNNCTAWLVFIHFSALFGPQMLCEIPTASRNVFKRPTYSNLIWCELAVYTCDKYFKSVKFEISKHKTSTTMDVKLNIVSNLSSGWPY